MPERDHPLNLLYAVRDAGLAPPELNRLRVAVEALVHHEIDRESRGGVRRRAPAGRRVARPGAGSLVAVLSTAVTLAVVLAAILLLAHPRPHRPEAGGSRADAALVSRLAVLRRPQTTADRLSAYVSRAAAQRGEGTIVPSLTRLVAVTPHARLFLVVRHPVRGPAPYWSPSLGDQVSILSVVGVDTAETPSVPAAALDNAAAIMPSAGERGFATDSPGSLFVAIIPDGVARARWTFADQHLHRRRAIDLSPVDNVAYVPFTGRTSVLRHAAWYRADGSVIPTSARALQRANLAQQAILSARLTRADERHPFRADPALLSDFSVFAVTSPTGVRTARGDVISHPPASALPYPILAGAAVPGQPPALDLRAIRQVTTPAGDRFWVLPGRRGLCVATLDPPHLPDRPFPSGNSNCSPSIALAESAGVGFSDRQPGGPTTTYRIVPKSAPTLTVRDRQGHRRTIRPADGIYVSHST